LKPALLRLAAAACCTSLLAGCANQLPQRSEHEERVERSLLSHSLRIDVGQPPVMQTPQRRISVTEERTFRVTVYEVARRYDRYTPYQPWRELYEIPLGVVAVVGGIGANVVNVFALGKLPDSVTKGWIDYGVAGLNPAMNVESNGRAEQNLAELQEDRKEQHDETTTTPWGRRPLLVQANGQNYDLTTDRNGTVLLNLLDAPFTGAEVGAITRLDISAQTMQDPITAEAQLEVSPALRGRLAEAHALVFDELEEQDIAQWVYRVRRLSQLGFEHEADELQQSLVELTANDPDLQHEFLDRLGKETGRSTRATGAR
jgi:hypothetical protein